MVAKASADISTDVLDAVVIGAGAAGVGVGIALKDAGLGNFAILERYRVGSSFEAWPAETRLITPSFPSNSIGMLDLNAVAIGVSPAYSIEVEHPTGKQYAAHLRGVAKYFELPVREGVGVRGVAKVGDEFRVDLGEEVLRCKHVVWAAGEFQYPQLGQFPGADWCRHTATIARYEALQGDAFLVIGGGESGIDAAYYLSSRGKVVRVLDAGHPWATESSDPSLGPSTYSRVRMRQAFFRQHVELIPDASVTAVTHEELPYVVETEDGRTFESETAPILAGGFAGSHAMVADLFETRAQDGFPLLSEHDESTLVPGLFLCGPAVRHGCEVFCFIYKYRQRFAVVAKRIAEGLGLPAERLELYRRWGMYLDDLSCCGEECVC